MQAELIRVEKADLPRAIGVLVRAFHDDPLWVYAVPNPEKRSKALHHLFSLTSATMVRTGEIYTTSPAFEGVAVWAKPDQGLTTADVLRHGLRPMLMTLVVSGFGDFRRIMDVLSTFEARQEQDAPARFWHLMQMGVAPDQQGKGFGRFLLEQKLAQIDQAQEYVYLETETPENVAFYEKRGFRVVTEGPVKGGGPTLWTMARPPQG